MHSQACSWGQPSWLDRAIGLLPLHHSPQVQGPSCVPQLLVRDQQTGAQEEEELFLHTGLRLEPAVLVGGVTKRLP